MPNLHGAPTPMMRGVLDEPDDLVRVLHMLEACRIDGRLHVEMAACSGDVFIAQGHIVAATCGSSIGASALATLLDGWPIGRISLYAWQLLDGIEVTACQERVLTRLVARRTEHVSPPDPVAQLATEVRQRIQQPVDALEISAQLESLGVTDEVAVQRYASMDVFALAEQIQSRLLAASPDTR